MTGQDKMPFGAYGGKPMKDVPADYLLHLWTTGMRHNHTSPVRDFIIENIEDLKTKHPSKWWD